MDDGRGGDPGPGPWRRGRLATAAALAAVAAALALFVAFGLLGMGWGGRLGEIDFGQHYAAGVAWRTGRDPYDPAQYRPVADSVFAGNERYRRLWTIYDAYFYPPTASTPSAAWSALAVDEARLVLVGMNLVAVVAVALSLGRSARRRGASPAVVALVVALAIGMSATAANVWMGQTTLLVVAACCASWACRDAGRPAAAGAVAALATVKPSISAFVVLALLMGRRRWATAAGLSAGALLLSAVALWSQGPVGAAAGWLGTFRLHGSLAVNQPGDPQAFGLRALLAALHLGGAGWAAVLAPIGFAWAWWRRDAMDSTELLGVCLALPVLFIQGHGYDVVALLPLLSAAMVRAERSGSAAAMLGVLATSAAASVPGRALRMVGDWPLAWRSREVVLLALLAAFVVAVERRRAAIRPSRRP